MYSYTVENRQFDNGFPVKITTIYPLNVGMYVQLGGTVEKVVEIMMYNDEAIIVVEGV